MTITNHFIVIKYRTGSEWFPASGQCNAFIFWDRCARFIHSSCCTPTIHIHFSLRVCYV